jgi:hypothetical protein
MARVHPFRAWRYSPSSVHLQDADAQPWNRINLVRVLLELSESFDAKPRQSVYCGVDHNLPVGFEKGVLVDEKAPCTFAEARQFTPRSADRVYQSRGLTADLAFLARPMDLEQSKQVTSAGDVLRTKPTDFFPQPKSGLANYALD